MPRTGPRERPASAHADPGRRPPGRERMDLSGVPVIAAELATRHPLSVPF